jgi:hypothetical protein
MNSSFLTDTEKLTAFDLHLTLLTLNSSNASKSKNSLIESIVCLADLLWTTDESYNVREEKMNNAVRTLKKQVWI